MKRGIFAELTIFKQKSELNGVLSMNAIRCPNCNSINQLSAVECQQCQMPFGNLPTTAYFSVPTEQTYEAQAFGFNPPLLSMPQDSEIGRKTYLWYRVYCGVMAGMYFLLIFLGIFMATVVPPTRQYESPQENLIIGIVYTVLGVVFFLIFAVALFLPRKSYNWIVGIVMMALGMTSCCFLPFLIPLMIYWVKPETKAYFGRN
jgi:hypothetical protein